MKLLSFRSKRRALPEAEFYKLKAKLDVDPDTLQPSGEAKHDVTLNNNDTMAYGFSVRGECGPMLRYGNGTGWEPDPVKELKPKEDTTVAGRIKLPGNCKKSELPRPERITVEVSAKPINPRFLGQKGNIYRNVQLRP